MAAKVLITAASFAGAYRLKSRLQQPDILMGDYRDLPELMLKAGKLLLLPNPQSASYVHEMLTLCLDKQIEQVHVMDDKEAALLGEAIQLFEEYGLKLIFYPNEL